MEADADLGALDQRSLGLIRLHTKMTTRPVDDDKQVALAIGDVLASSDLRDLGKDILEVGVDAFFVDGFAKDLPVVGAFFSVLDGAHRVRQHFLRRKLLVFLTDVSRANVKDRQDVFARLFGTPKERQALCSLLLHTIDEMRSETRVRVIAALFVGLLTGALSEGSFRRLAEVTRAIEPAHVELLTRLADDSPRLTTDADITFLAMHALAVADYTPHSDSPGVRYRRLPLGTELVLAFAGIVDF